MTDTLHFTIRPHKAMLYVLDLSTRPEGEIGMSVADDREAQKAARIQWQKQVKDRLTQNEWEVVKLAARGLTNPEIAARTIKGRATVKTYIQSAVSKLGPFAAQVGVLSMNRVGLAVVCLRAGQMVKTPCPEGWAITLDQTLTSSERVIIVMAADAGSDQELARKSALQGLGGQLGPLYQKIAPFLVDANIEDSGREAMVELFVRAGTVASPAMYKHWRAFVRSSVTRRERDVLTWLTKGLGNQEIGVKLGISPLTVKSHLDRVTTRLGPYAPFVGVERPGNRAGLAVIAILAGLDRIPHQ